jgi:diguanylate cyclase (GGDEF)-like protein/PAS domain S-box-containing protein
VTNARCRATGFAATELIGRRLAEVGAPPDETGTDPGTLIATLRAGEAWKGEFKLRRKDGGALWASAVLSPRRRGAETVGYTAIWQDITESMRYRELSLRDELTGLFNRRHFNAEAPLLLEAARREGKLLAVVALDVDNFKAYNDTYGHGAGDRVLAVVGETLREGLRRETDHAFRLGGEEFAAVLAVAEKADAVRIAEAVRELLQARAIPHAGNPPGVVTTSAGVAIAGPDDRRDMDALLGAADAALYVAKRGGRNRVAVAPAVPDRATVAA